MRYFELPKKIEHFLATLFKMYAHENEMQLQGILVNSAVRVQEEWSADGWNGGIYGHALFLTIPEVLFFQVNKNKENIGKKIREDLNNLHNVQNEFIDEVFIELEVRHDVDWRKTSGVLLGSQRVVVPVAKKRIWGSKGFRIFLSHKTESKKETAILKDNLKLFGITCFVAHEDIKPTEAWQDEIENALDSMDGFVALMTENFHQSDWTDQEVGYAFAKKVPIVAVRLGRDPYGFIGKFQGLACSWGNAPLEIVKILIKNNLMFNNYLEALKTCPNWDAGNILAKALEGIDTLSSDQINTLIKIYNETPNIKGSFGFNGARPLVYGKGLVFHLNRLQKGKFVIDIKGSIQAIS